MDLIIFSGQSNMQGQTEKKPNDHPNIHAKEYCFLSNTTRELCNPVGEDIGNELLASHLGHGSLVPYFVNHYIKTMKNKRNVLAVHVAKGDTRIEQWQKNTEEGQKRYQKLVEKVQAAKQFLDEKGHILFVWLQGESDALAKTSKIEYMTKLQQLKNNLKQDIGIEKFMVIEVGYFASIVKNLKENDEIIQDAQQTICREDSDFLLLTDITKKLSMNSHYLNPDAEGHFNNKAMKIIGKKAGKMAAQYIKKIEQ